MSPTILVADDDPDIVELVRVGLERAGLEVVTAGDGEAAWRLIREEPPAAAVIDVAMPRLDGLALTRRVRHDERTSHVPILILTAALAPTESWRATAAGANAFLSKPFSPKELLKRVQNLLEG